jgi:carbon storage regulator
MLILTRRTGETTEIKLEDGRVLEVAILGVVGNQVRVGFSAPKTIEIDRAEIAKRKRDGAKQRSGDGEEANGNVAPEPADIQRQTEACYAQRERVERDTMHAAGIKLGPSVRYKKSINPDSLEARRKKEGIW